MKCHNEFCDDEIYKVYSVRRGGFDYCSKGCANLGRMSEAFKSNNWVRVNGEGKPYGNNIMNKD